MAKSESDHTYTPKPMTRQPAGGTPYDQTKSVPADRTGTGKYGGLGAKVTGGEMNTGGKRRPVYEKGDPAPRIPG